MQSETTKLSDRTSSGRREFLRMGAAGVAALAAGLAPAQSGARQSEDKRVCILVDTETHMMPALAKEMAGRDHNLVIGNVADGLPDQLMDMGAKVEVVPGKLDLTKPEAVQSIVEAALSRFGRVDSACVRTGAHRTGEIMDISTADAQFLYEGNLLAVIYALQALLKPMLAQGSGQIVINTSATGLRPVPAATMYSACRAGANSVIRSAALTAAPKGVAINATGTFAMDYPGFLEDAGADKDPAIRKQIENSLPMRKLVEPEQAAHFVATLIDGVGTSQTAQFFAIDAGWSFM